MSPCHPFLPHNAKTSQREKPIDLIIKNKRPGPGGFSATYYKKIADLLSPILVNAYNTILTGQAFRSETLTATISMLPKPQKDDSWSNYRPIPLLNLDIKLLAKILATWLNLIIGSLIHKDQVGFIPTRQAGDNIRRATLLAHITRTRNIQLCFLSLDVKKLT